MRDIHSLCYGREDLLAVAEQIAYESEIPLADGEELCELLAQTCKNYLLSKVKK